MFIIDIIIWLCLTRAGNYQIHEFDWVKSILKAVKIFPSRPASRPVMFAVKSFKLKFKIIDYCHVTILFIAVPKSLMIKESKEKELTLAELNSGHRQLQAKCQLVQTSYIERIKLILFAPHNEHLINRA